MNDTATITPAIIDTLYEESLQLAEEARAIFEFRDEFAVDGKDNASDIRMARSCEALRTTTRIMHAIAWLLNMRAYFAGEMSETQLRRHGRLPPPQPAGDATHRALLDRLMAEMEQRSRDFYARVERLEAAWRAEQSGEPAAVHSLRERLGAAFAS